MSMKVPNRDVTPNDIPDPSPLPKIPGPYIVVRPVAFEDKVGSILLPDSYKDDVEHLTNVGRVVVVGDLAYTEPKETETRFGRPWCKTGDFVVWGRHRGQRFCYKGVKLHMLSDDEILMVVESPVDIDPTKNMVKY